MQLIDIAYLLFLIAMLLQGFITLFLTLYVWEDASRLDEVASPKVFREPLVRFTVLLPARHEQAVIAQTIRSIAAVNYPAHMLQIINVCDDGDIETITAARTAISESGIWNATVLTYHDKPINKPHGLNVGLQAAKHEAIVIFDAEDEVNPDIFNIANTLFIERRPDIIQAGVQLMNYNSKWFSGHNVLEYFFWFKSRMHYHTRVGMVPLGGNTVFFKTSQVRKMGGWNEECLTEDAEIGIRMSVKGAKVISTYDPFHVTKEETPSSLGQFIKQRTRWNQGFIQVLRYGYWKDYDSLFKRIFCVYTLSFPLVQAVLLLLTPLLLAYGIYDRLPIALSLLSYIPILIWLLQYVISAVGMRELIKEQGLPNHRRIYFQLLITLIPYQIMLGLGAIRATYRELRGFNNWEKTAHNGLHRKPERLSEIEVAT